MSSTIVSTAAGTPIGRIVVVVDAVSEHRAALDTAARLAARWKAELHGVFVEDDELLRLAALPFARQVSLSAGVEALTLQLAQRQLRAFAETARRDLLAAARRHQVEASFEVARGAAGADALGVSPSDFIVSCTLTRPVGGYFRMECRACSAGSAGQGSVLLAHRPWGAAGSVAILLRDREPGSVRLIEAAAGIAAAAGGELTVVCPPGLAHSPGFDRWLAERLAGRDVRVAVELAPVAPAALMRRIVELNCRIVAIEAHAAEPGRLRDIARIACDVLIVR